MIAKASPCHIPIEPRTILLPASFSTIHAFLLGVNLDSIRALEQLIQDYERAVSQLERARTSVLDILTILPPEVLVSNSTDTRLPRALRSFSALGAALSGYTNHDLDDGLRDAHQDCAVRDTIPQVRLKCTK